MASRGVPFLHVAFLSRIDLSVGSIRHNIVVGVSVFIRRLTLLQPLLLTLVIYRLNSRQLRGMELFAGESMAISIARAKREASKDLWNTPKVGLLCLSLVLRLDESRSQVPESIPSKISIEVRTEMMEGNK